MAPRLIMFLVLAFVVVACGGGDATTSESGTSTPQTASDPSDISAVEGGDASDAGVDIGSLGSPPEADPQTAVAVVDGTTYTFAAAELGSARCEIESDRVAINIGQSEDWFAFVATAAGGTWTTGPSFGLEDAAQHEGLTPGSRIEVADQQVTFQGEIVIKVDQSDFDSWIRTIGSVTANCESG